MMIKFDLPAPTNTERQNYRATEKIIAAKTGKIGGSSSPRLVINQDYPIIGKNDTYILLSNERIGSGGESQVFYCVSKSDNRRFVAKVYDNMEDTPAQNELMEEFCEFLIQNADTETNYLMPLYDYGEINIVNNGRNYRRHVDVLPFCKNDVFESHERISFERLRNEVIPHLAKALNTLHEERFVHRDVKPSNIFILDGTVVLGDFGTISKIEEDDDFTLTSKHRGTLGYTAPEVAGGGYATPESDWYSLGCTIATLYLGKHPYEEILKAKDRSAFIRNMNTKGLPLNCPAEEQSLQFLVDSLIIANEKDRAGYKETEEWCANPSSYKRKTKKEYRGSNGFYFVFDGTECFSPEQLANEMLSKWEVSIKYLYRGGSQNSVVVQGLAKCDQSLAVKAGDVIENKETARNYNLGMARFLYYLADNGHIYWKGRIYKDLDEIAREIGVDADHDNELIELLQSGYLSWILNDTEHHSPNETRTKNMMFIENITNSYSAFGLYFYKYVILRNEKYIGMKSGDEIFDYYFSWSRRFEQESAVLFQNDKLLGFMATKGSLGSVIDYLNTDKDKDFAYRLTRFYEIFEEACSDKEKVRKHYFTLGPKAYLFWIRNNLDAYNFVGESGNKIKSRIMSFNAVKGMGIKQLEAVGNSIGQLVLDLKTHFQGNPLMVYYSLNCTDTNKYIRANNMSAYFTDKYFGAEIPYGYKLFLDGGKTRG